MKFALTPLAAAVTVALTACGGGGDDVAVAAASVSDAAVVAAADGDFAEAQPAFHRIPVELAAPVDHQEPNTYAVSSEVMQINTVNLLGDGEVRKKAQAAGNTGLPSTITVYTPAQIRTAYGMTSLAQSTAADLGAGQTIYIIGAYHNPNLLKDLNTFNQRFNLPQCKEVAIPVGTTKLNPADPADGCTVSIVYSTTGPKITSKAPAYDKTWAAESALDVQWAHATAPLARIVVFESVNSFVNSFADALQLANSFGPGVVSMSWVAGEQLTYTERYEKFFTGAGMTYFAAAGDFGTQSNWPATSPSVVAVSGTTLRANSAGRTETAWSKTGGGYSAFFTAPDYQAALTTGAALTGRYSTTPGRPARASSDVAFNADPYTGQYTVFTPNGGTASWYSYGGTSIATPQWAGITAVINARRAVNGLATVGKFHSQLYSALGPSIGAYAQTFADVQAGSNGTCANCTARMSWDLPTGWGTPNVGYLINNMSR